MVLSAPLELVISILILWYLVGWEALTGAGMFFCLVAFQVLLAKKAASLSEKAASFTDERLMVMNEIISGIRAVKMYAWEWNFRDLVHDLRRKEMSVIRLKGVIVAILVVLYFTTLPIASLISVVTLAFTGTQLSAFTVFTLLLGLTTIRATFCYNLSMSMQMVADAVVALNRIQMFLEEQIPKYVAKPEGSRENDDRLLTKERVRKYGLVNPIFTLQESDTHPRGTQDQKNNGLSTDHMNFEDERPESSKSNLSWLTTHGSVGEHQGNASHFKTPCLSITDVSCSWNQKDLPNTLTGITLDIMSSKILAIIGEVGSGKSTLLQAVLGELPLHEGIISYQGKIAYAAQVPWVFSGTIRENILFGLPFDEQKFQHVVDVCGLTKDFTDLVHGDLTEIGERGATLSGGQKARVGLARAVYSDADIYLLDDPLSAVDTKVGRKLFEGCICNHLSGSIRLLVTHQLQHLKGLDHIAVMKNGSIINEGTFTELKQDEIFSDLEESFKHHGPEQRRKSSLSHFQCNKEGHFAWMTNRRLSLVSPTFLKTADDFPNSSRRVTMFDLRGTKPQRKLSTSNVLAKCKGNKETSILEFEGNRELSTVGERDCFHLSKMEPVPSASEQPVVGIKEDEENLMSGTVTWRLYWKYFKEGLPLPMILVLAVSLIAAQVSLIVPNWWLAKIAEMSYEKQKVVDIHVIYAILVAVSIIIMTASSFLLYYILLKASETLHNKMTIATIKAPVFFFDTNPAGRILNRFSKDVGCMDYVLPPLFLEAIKFSLFSLCTVLVPAATNYWLFLALLPIIAIFGYYARYQLKSTRGMKRIEAVKCSPVYSHITDTLNGLEIIHTSNMDDAFIQKFYRYQDENTQAFIMVISCTRWLSIRLDLMSSLFITIVALTAILVVENPVLAGLALTYVLQSLDITQYSVRLASEVENLMTSVERVMSYAKIGSEPGYSIETRPPQSWPGKGSLKIKQLSLAYHEGGPCVLKNITFNTCEKEKIGVVGRTGAGKSSLVSALFRMPEPSGKVFIDDVDITSINLQEARRSMVVITQDPVLFAGTLRRNLDPFIEHTDAELWMVLEEVQLKALVEDLPGLLEFKLKESGANFSVGERQLICLARALVQKSKIIVMDEATANVDFKTDRLIQQVIRHKFKDSTVLTIAHRLNTIMDYDKVLVLDGGRVVEFDKPEVLMRNGGIFAEMVKSQTQSSETQN
ncbi:ATP-binding cassette sub-family C member 4-like [Pocillopora verrucosa]|uniref:ATP-binding cassette sub-family C member 4-like n=1 Tax=Pocillopora verrucosa TaxID=203993 RepID=UPI00333E7541